MPVKSAYTLLHFNSLIDKKEFDIFLIINFCELNAISFCIVLIIIVLQFMYLNNLNYWQQLTICKIISKNALYFDNIPTEPESNLAKKPSILTLTCR